MKEKKITTLLLGGIMLAALLLAGYNGIRSGAERTVERFPDKPITIIIPTSAGGGPDMMVRAMEKAVMKHFGQPLTVRNLPGGAATKSWNELAGAEPDGYTVGVATTGLILQPHYGPTRFHYPSALEPLAQVVTVPIVAVARADRSWETIHDVAAYAKQHPGMIKFGHPGLGSPKHVVGEMFAKEAAIRMQQVPFDGEPEALAALLGGHVQLIFTDTSVIKEQVKSGKVKVLAMATEQRSTDPIFKDVATFKEQGLDVVFSLWYGICAPKRLPGEVKAKLAAGFKETVNDPEFQEYMVNLGMTAAYLGPEEFGRKWRADSERLQKIITDTGLDKLIAKQKY